MLVKYFPVSTIATTYITDMWHFGKVALDGGYSFITHFGQFLCSYLRIVSDLFLYPIIKFFILRDILRVILSNILGNILGNILSNILGITVTLFYIALCSRLYL